MCLASCRDVSSNIGLEILITALIPLVQEEAPDNVCGESPGEKNHQNRKPLPKGGRAVLKCDGFNRIACGESVSKASAHDARERPHEQAFLQIELFDRGTLLLVVHFALFANTSSPGEGDAYETDGNTSQYHKPGSDTAHSPRDSTPKHPHPYHATHR